MDFDIFLRDQNIALYRKLLNSSTDEVQRRTIFKLLAEEMTKLKRGPQQVTFGGPVIAASEPRLIDRKIRDDGKRQGCEGDWERSSADGGS